MIRSIAPYVAGFVTGPTLRDARRVFAELRRRLRGAPHRVSYFHQVDDPYSHLAAQVLERLQARYPLELAPELAGPPPDDAAPEREKLVGWSRIDAASVAPYYGLEFSDPGHQPEPGRVALAKRILANAAAEGRFPRAAPAVGSALWSSDAAALESLASELGTADEATARSAVERGDSRRRALGHYLGATFHYAGEWYWGVDRLQHLERRLQALGLLREGHDAAPLVARPVFELACPPGGEELTLEFFPSLRSPYSAIAMARVFELVERTGVTLVLRPVLPMVMRGLPVPSRKRRYIVFDAKREAEDAGVAFGRVSDPVGRPVERAFSLYPWVRSQGRAAEYLHAFTSAAFAEGVDAGTDAGLARVVERAGLSWKEARGHVADGAWREEVEANRKELFEAGLWGVPSFRLRGLGPDFETWGQDRIWRLEAEIRARLERAGR